MSLPCAEAQAPARCWWCRRIWTRCFLEGTDVKVKKAGDEKYFAPGIYDDGRGPLRCSPLIRALNATLRSRPLAISGLPAPLAKKSWATRESALFRDNNKIDGFISLSMAPQHRSRGKRPAVAATASASVRVVTVLPHLACPAQRTRWAVRSPGWPTSKRRPSQHHLHRRHRQGRYLGQRHRRRRRDWPAICAPIALPSRPDPKTGCRLLHALPLTRKTRGGNSRVSVRVESNWSATACRRAAARESGSRRLAWRSARLG